MKVFNLTDKPIAYRHKTLAAYASSDFDITNVSDRDLALQKAGLLAFGSLPRGWKKPEPIPVPKPVPAVAEVVVVSEKLSLGLKELPKEEKSDWKKKR